MKPYALLLPPAMIAALQERAKATKTPVAAVIRAAIKAHLEQQ
jgi:predicted DNA-binding protein